MRSILIDLLVDVHRKFELMPETLYLTINLVDRFLSLTMVHRRYFSCWDYRKQVLAMEKSILGQVEWYITVPTPYGCLARYVKASVPCDIEMEKLVFYLAELWTYAISYSCLKPSIDSGYISCLCCASNP
ncbi:unnamed protein product [Arabidopsis halleri]